MSYSASIKQSDICTKQINLIAKRDGIWDSMSLIESEQQAVHVALMALHFSCEDFLKKHEALQGQYMMANKLFVSLSREAAKLSEEISVLAEQARSLRQQTVEFIVEDGNDWDVVEESC